MVCCRELREACSCLIKTRKASINLQLKGSKISRTKGYGEQTAALAAISQRSQDTTISISNLPLHCQLQCPHPTEVDSAFIGHLEYIIHCSPRGCLLNTCYRLGTYEILEIQTWKENRLVREKDIWIPDPTRISIDRWQELTLRAKQRDKKFLLEVSGNVSLGPHLG